VVFPTPPFWLAHASIRPTTGHSPRESRVKSTISAPSDPPTRGWRTRLRCDATPPYTRLHSGEMSLRITAPAARSCGRRSTWNRRRRASSGQRPALSGGMSSLNRASAGTSRQMPALARDGGPNPAASGPRPSAAGAGCGAGRTGPTTLRRPACSVAVSRETRSRAYRWSHSVRLSCATRRQCLRRTWVSSPSGPGTSPPRGPRALRTGASSAPTPVAGHPSSS